MKENVKTFLASLSVFYIITILFLFKPVALLKVTSASMEPALLVGSICFVDKRPDLNAIKTGDMIVYSLWDGMLVVHRVVGINKYGFITKGDANEREDPVVVNEENIYGKVLFVL